MSDSLTKIILQGKLSPASRLGSGGEGERPLEFDVEEVFSVKLRLASHTSGSVWLRGSV